MPQEDIYTQQEPKQLELRLHGTTDFPCGSYEIELGAEASEGIAWHWHEETELVYVVEGQVELLLPDMTWQLSVGEGAFIHANVPHSMISVAGNGKIHYIMFHTDLIAGNRESVFQKKYITPLMTQGNPKGVLLTQVPEWQKDTLYMIQKTQNVLEEKQEGYEWEVRQLLSQIWFRLYQNCHSIAGGKSPKRMDEERLHKMLALMEKNYSKPLDLAQIAAAADIGERECLRCFQRTMGTSPLQYLLRYRITQASIMLRETTLPIAEIGIRCGFDSPSHFAQTFRKYFSITPSIYRKSKN